ncbi:hypothetical protein PVK06_019530 [Gossypium arboreum]|uniref:DUF4216 domain-containing protein n=1 Tax=Gossypium arboreum TaxID=29729 RepID=A0ABR0PJZ7_GOSAR|nr:hypothetical protein PVK06_019530 [Gossypium arboreum]
MEGMLWDAFNMNNHGLQSFPPNFIASDDCNIGGNVFTKTGRSVLDEEPNRKAVKFYKLLNEMNEELYEGSKYSKMSFYIRLFHLKCLGGWIENSFTMLLEFLRDIFLFAKIPHSCKDMKKLIKDLGLRFHTKSLERLRRTQNCGIIVNSSITRYASARESNPVEGNVEYYGLLINIIELDYYGKQKVVLFQCDWADVNTARGIKNDQFGFTMVNFSRLIHIGEQLIDERYVFSSQVKQVFYSKDPTDEGWYVVLRNTPRDLFDIGNGSRDDIVERSETFPFLEQNLNENIPSTSTQFQSVHQDVDEDIYEL